MKIWRKLVGNIEHCLSACQAMVAHVVVGVVSLASNVPVAEAKVSTQGTERTKRRKADLLGS